MRTSEPLDLALVVTGAGVVVALALGEMYAQLGSALAAYAAAWGVLGLERRRSGDQR